MRILFTGANHDSENWRKQSYSLANASHQMGHFVCSSFLDAPDVLICVDYHKRSEPLLSEAKNRGTPRVLIRQEPIVVQPQHGKKKLLDRFELVITRGNPRERPQFNTFQEWDTSEIDNATRFKRTVAISANKWSMIPGEYYSLRRKAYSQIDGIDVFGPGWNSSTIEEVMLVTKELVISLASGVFPEVSNLKWSLIRPQSYLGVAASKIKTLSRYEVSLVIENSAGYMSEKLVDSILAGTIPVYVGENVENFGIPAGLVIQAEPAVEAIRSAISQALNWDGHRYRMEAKAWAQSAGVKENWEKSCVSKKLLDYIESRFRVQKSS